MKKMNKILAIILATLMIISVIPISSSAATYSGTCGDNVIWSFDESTGTLTISGIGDMYDFRKNNAPWNAHKDSIENVVISEGVTIIGDCAFYNYENIKNVSMADSVTIIGNDTFYGCTGLTDVAIGKGVTAIAKYAFYNCSNLETVTMNNDVDVIDFWSFVNCPKLTDVYYLGTEAEWNTILKGSFMAGISLGSTGLEEATIHFLGEETHECSYNAVVTAPTCTEQGYTTYTCVCGDSYVADYVDALGHIEETVPAVAPTCTETGLTAGAKCSVCGETLTEQKELPANGHTPSTAVEENYIAPTCTENGSKDVVIYCTECDKEISRETETIDATGHADNDGDGYCDACNEQLEDNNDSQISIISIIMMIINFILELFGIK